MSRQKSSALQTIEEPFGVPISQPKGWRLLWLRGMALLRWMLSPVLRVVWGLSTGLIWGGAELAVELFKGCIKVVRRSASDLLWVAEQLARGPRGLKAIAEVLDPWVRAFWPLVGVCLAGVTVFQQAVIQSIASTPHPELVYTIFGVALAASLLAAFTLSRYLGDAQLAQSLLKMGPEDRKASILAMEEGDFKSALTLSVTPMGHHPGEHRELVENDLLACEDRMFARLTLPTYLGGSLIGIGLVGTFVGLLAALADLAGVFSALMGGNVGAAGSDPMALFSGMLVKLQEPMKGMATAFVASLYGLMGSLLLGLVVYSVRKTGEEAVACMRDVLRDQDRLTTIAMHESVSQQAIDPTKWQQSMDVLTKHQELLELLLTDLIQSLKTKTLDRER